MAIPFSVFPSYRRASIVAIESEARQRSVGGSYVPMIVLIIGQYLSTKSPTDYVPVKVLTADEVADVAGRGSEAHRQAIRFFAQMGGFYENAYYAPIPEADESVEANGTVTFTGTATSSGTFYIALGGNLYQINVAKDDTDDDIAAALVAAITADVDAPFSAAVGTEPNENVVTVTCKWAGANGNEISVVLNPDGASQTAQNPASVAVTVPETGYLTSGAGVPDVEDVFLDDGADILGDRWYTLITAPYTDDTNLELYKDSFNLRNDPAFKRPFVAVPAYVKKTYSEALALPATINNKGVCMVWEDRCCAPSFELSADIIGAIAFSAIADPCRPYKGLELGVMVNSATGDRSSTMADALFRAGMGYCRVTTAGNLVLGDLATTYRTTAAGVATEEDFDLVGMTHRMQKIYSLDQLFSSPPYDRAILGTDDMVTRKSYVIKPKKIIADLHNMVDYWASEGWTKNAETVKASITAEINALNASRADAEMTDDPAKALRIIAMKYAYLY